jgi:hypothetical protein
VAHDISSAQTVRGAQKRISKPGSKVKAAQQEKVGAMLEQAMKSGQLTN